MKRSREFFNSQKCDDFLRRYKGRIISCSYSNSELGFYCYVEYRTK